MAGTTPTTPLRLVLVTGAPGSGKTTLGTALARAVRMPFLARDDVRGGLFATSGGWTDSPTSLPSAETAVDTTLRIVETMVGLGVSCVVEYVVRTGRPDDLARMTEIADCVVIMTSCADSVMTRRLVDRNRRDPLLTRRPVLEALGFGSIEEHTADMVGRMEQVRDQMATSFGLPTLQVSTDDGLCPGLEEIADFATAQH